MLPIFSDFVSGPYSIRAACVHQQGGSFFKQSKTRTRKIDQMALTTRDERDAADGASSAQSWGRVVTVKGSSVVAVSGGTANNLRVQQDGSNPFGVEVHDRQSLATADAANASSWFPSAAASLVIGTDLSSTFWKPDAASPGQMGLLEALHRRGSNNKTFILVHSRPDAELSRNFSLSNGQCIDVSKPRFKLSRTSIALQNIQQLPDGIAMQSGAVRKGMTEQLPNLKLDEFFMLRYRDYSDWAVKEYGSEAKRDTILGPKYVERFFALRVGNNAGVLIPITEAQLVAGFELLQKRELEQAHHTAAAQDIAAVGLNKYALTEDQYRSLGGLGEELASPQAGATTSPSPAPNNSRQAPYEAPSWYDWTPGAVQKRIAHQLEEQYRSVGRFVVKGLLVGFCLYLGIHLVRKGMGVDGSGGYDDRRPTPRGANRRLTRRGRPSAQEQYDDAPSGGIVGSIVRGFFSVGPKQLFDFILAPSSSST